MQREECHRSRSGDFVRQSSQDALFVSQPVDCVSAVGRPTGVWSRFFKHDLLAVQLRSVDASCVRVVQHLKNGWEFGGRILAS